MNSFISQKDFVFIMDHLEKQKLTSKELLNESVVILLKRFFKESGTFSWVEHFIIALDFGKNYQQPFQRDSLHDIQLNSAENMYLFLIEKQKKHVNIT